MLYEVVVKEVQIHHIYFEAESEEEAEQNWWDYFGNEDYDEINELDAEILDIEEAE